MQRVPEPELMDDPQQALAYARADFSEPHDHFVELFRQHWGNPGNITVLDLGCGPGDICRRFARAFPECRIHGLDASPAMLELGRSDSRAAQLEARIEFIQGYLPDAALAAAPYDVIISNSLLHHLENPQVLWQSLLRYGHAETRVLIMDLMRPGSLHEVESLVETYAGNEPEVLRRDFHNSLCAAYTPDEVSAQLSAQGLELLNVATVSNRHLIVWGTSGRPQSEPRR